MSNKKYAHAKRPTFTAILEENWNFKTIKEAQDRIQRIKQFFIVSRRSNPDDINSIVLWIYDFMITPNEREEGYKGNFGRIQIKETQNGSYTLTIEKEVVPLEYHPIKRPPKRDHPNWRHPILRKHVKEKKPLRTEREAQDLLASLHKEFSKTTIPASANKLFIIVFESHQKPPIQRYVFTVEKDDTTNTYYLKADINRTSSKWLDWKVYEQHDSVFIYAYGKKAVVDQDTSTLSGEE